MSIKNKRIFGKERKDEEWLYIQRGGKERLRLWEYSKLRTADTSKKAKDNNEEKKDPTKLVSSRRGLMEESVRNLK